MSPANEQVRVDAPTRVREAPFRVGLTRDLLTPGGEPSFGSGPLQR